jgi:dCMP deaminase
LDNKIIISGYNHLTDGIETSPEWNERPLKYKGTVHSESDAITKAARQGIKLDGGVMYMPWLPCTQCYLMMKNAGIKRLVAHKNMIEMSPPHWEEDINMMLYLADKGNFEIILYEGKIGGVKSLFNGQEWEP